MATQPHPTQAPPKPEPPKPPAAKVEAATAPNLRPDGPTIAELQRESSAEIEKMGMSKYVEAHDERPAGERSNKQIPGVVPPTKRE